MNGEQEAHKEVDEGRVEEEDVAAETAAPEVPATDDPAHDVASNKGISSFLLIIAKYWKFSL